MLHIISSIDALQQAKEYALDTDAYLLLEDAVYAINPQHFACGDLITTHTYALLPDVEARGIVNKAAKTITLVDFAGFVDLTAEHSHSITW